MGIYTEDLSHVPAADEAVPEGPYQFRIASVDDTTVNDKNEVQIICQCKIQTEGPVFGQQVRIQCSLKGFGLSVLKSLYKATGYNPGAEGHDPSRLLDGEFRGTVVHKQYQGQTFANIAPASIKALIG